MSNLRFGFALVVLAASITGCGAIWGFDSPIVDDSVTDAQSSDAQLADVAVGADTSCDAECIVAAPADWQGPFVIAERAGDASQLPSCPSAYPTAIYDGVGEPTAPPATCACTCMPPTGVACAAPTMDVYADSNCTTLCATADQAIATTCTAVGGQGCGSNAYYRVDTSTPTGGSCAPKATRDVPAASWNVAVRLCGAASPLPQLGCGSASVCAPAPASPFDAMRCIARMGIQTCPAGYPSQRIYYDGTSNDTRDCSPCTCDAPDGGCAASATLYGDPWCNAGSVGISPPTTCAKLGKSIAAKATAGPFTGGGCAPDGGTPIGTFAPAAPMTVCCTP